MNSRHFYLFFRTAAVAVVLVVFLLSTPGILPIPDVFAQSIPGRGPRSKPAACFPLTLTHKGKGANPLPDPLKSPGCINRYTFVAGQQIRLTAAPAAGWSVNRWTGTVNDHSIALTNMMIMPAQPRGVSVEYTNTLNLAVLAPLTGDLQYLGLSVRKGVMLAINEWNAKGGVLGRRIKAVYKDTRCEAAPTVEAANQLINKDNIRYIIGEVCSRASIPLSEIADARQVVMISPLSTNPGVTVYPDNSVKEYVFRAAYTDPYQGKPMGRFALGQGYTTAYLLYDPANGLEETLVNEFAAAFTSYGGQVLALETYSTGETDFTAPLSRVKDSGAQVLYMPVSATDANLIGAQAKALGVEAVLLGYDGWDLAELDRTSLEGGFYSTHFSPGDPSGAVQQWVSRYKTRYRTTPDAGAALGYDAANLMLESIRMAGADQPALVKDQMATISWKGVTGDIHFDAEHNPVKPVTVVSIGGGRVSFRQMVPPAASCSQEDAFCVGLVTDAGGLHDRGFNEAAWRGILKEVVPSGSAFLYLEPADPADYASGITALVNSGCDAVVTVGFGMSEATTQAAIANPDTNFIGIDQFQSDPLANLAGLIFPEDQGGFLVGVLAAGMTRSGKVGAVCGPDTVPAVWRFCEGYRAGVHYVDSGIETRIEYHNVDFSQAFSDPDWGKSTAQWLIDGGVDVVFGAAGPTGTGALLGAAERGVYAIGVDTDQYYTVPEAHAVLLSSALKAIEPGTAELVHLSRKDALQGGNFMGNADYAPYHELDGAVPPDLKTRMETVKAALQDGSLLTGVPLSKPGIKVAVMAPMSGGLSHFGEEVMKGAQIAISEVKEGGGLLGLDIEAEVFDTGCSGAAAVEAGRHALNRGIHYVIGEVCSSASIPLSDELNPRRVVMLSPTSTNSLVTVDAENVVKDYVFRAAFIDPYQGEAAARFAIAQGWTTVFMLYRHDDPYFQGLAGEFTAAFTGLGGAIVGEETYAAGTSDFTPQLQKLIDSGAQVLYTPVYPPDINQIAQQSRILGATATLLGGDAWESPDLDLAALEGAYFTSQYSADNPNASVQEFVAKYLDKYGVKPGSIAALGYDAARMLLQSIQTAGFDNPGLVKDVLAGLAYDGATGHLHIDPRHNPIKPVPILHIENGAFVYETTIEPPD